MAKITIQDTQRDLRKLYDIVTFEQYKIFHDELTIRLDEIFRQIPLNGDTAEVLINSSTIKSVRWITGEVLTVRGQFPSDDTSSWKLDTVSFTTVNGTTMQLKGKFKVAPDQSSFIAGTIISSIEVSSSKNLSSFFGFPNVVRKMNATGNFLYGGGGQFSGNVTTEDRTFDDGWQLNVDFDKRFTYRDGDYQSSGRGGFLELVDPAGLQVLKFDISDYDLGAEDADAYDEAYRERFFSRSDLISGTSSADNINSYTGNDTITSGTGNDTLVAGDGHDIVSAGDGADLIVGGDGAGNDAYDGGKGIDTVKYTSATAAISVNLAKGTASATAGGDAAGIGTDKLKGIENLIASDYADTLIGGKEPNLIEGGTGNDTIDGGLGKDTVVGGAGADMFVFSTKPAAGMADTLSGFEHDADIIVLSSKVFTKLKLVQDLSPHFAVDVAGNPQHYLIYQTTTGTLFYDADGSGRGKAVDIAIVGTASQLQASDIQMG